MVAIQGYELADFMYKNSENIRIVIVGAGGFGREVASWYLDSYGYEQNIVFLDDTKTGVIAIGPHQFRVVSDLDTYVRNSHDKVLMGVASPYAKQDIANKFGQKNIQFSTFIHKSVIRSLGADIGEGSIICPNSVLSDNVKLGKLTTVNLCCTIGHDSSIGDYTTLSSHVDITGRCQIGKFVFWGSGSRIIPNKYISDGCKIGAGSLIMHNIPEGKTVYCPPSKTM